MLKIIVAKDIFTQKDRQKDLPRHHFSSFLLLQIYRSKKILGVHAQINFIGYIASRSKSYNQNLIKISKYLINFYLACKARYLVWNARKTPARIIYLYDPNF